jgi:RNA polymerase sigma factor (sigma-70 family)
MASPESVTQWIHQLRAGDTSAARNLWEAYFNRLVGLARAKLRALPRRAADEEDVALSAFDSFCRGVERGRFPRLDDRDDLWQVLLLVTERKAIDLLQHEGRAKRDRNRLDAGGDELLIACASREPDPAFAAEVAEQCERLLAALPDDRLRTLALRKLEGFTNEEIAATTGCARATVERRLRLIRREWEEGSGG